MANKSGTIYGSPADNGNYLYIEWYEDASSISSSANTSKVYATVKLYNGYGSYSSGDACAWYVIIDGTKYSGTIYTWSGSPVTVGSASKVVTHNSNGSKSITISAYFDTAGTSTGTVTASGTATLSTIPRYATASQSLSSKTETSITMKWSSDSTVDYIWYSTNNGSSWTGKNVTDGKSGSYTISGLSAGTNYKIKTRVRRKDSQLTTDSSALSVTTYSYPYANSMPNFTIGNDVTIGIYNPLGRSVSIEMTDNSGNHMGTNTTSGTSFKGWSSTTIVNNLYASIPNAKSGTYKVKVTYSTHTTTKTGGTYSVNTTASKPSIGTATYADTNTTVTAITLDDQKIVRNKSTVRYTASNLTAKNSATISSCKVEVNESTYTLSKSGSSYIGGNAVINSGTNVTAKFTVTDSRGLTASKSVTVQMLDWAIPTAIISIERRNNFYSETDILVNAEYSYLDGKNTITINYKARKKGTSSWTLTGTLQDNVSSMVTIDNTYAWTFQITVTDLFGSKTYTVNVARGMPIAFFDRIRESVSVNKFPTHDQSFEVGGDAYLDGDLTLRGHSSPIGTVVENQNSSETVVPSGTVTNLMSITLDPGVWVIRVLVRFPAMGTDRTKYCSLHLTTTTTTTAYLYRQPCENMITQIPFTQIVSPDTTATYNVLVYHNSGSDRTFAVGSAIVQNIRAVRIA